MPINLPEATARQKYFKVAALCEILETSRDRICDLIAAGELTAVNISAPGSIRATWRIPEESLDAFLAARATRPIVAAKAKRSPKYKPQILKPAK